jgi:WhiB family redox-sensing transcriptional regulator
MKLFDGMDWLDGGRCIRVKDPDIFFPPRDKERYSVIAAEAKSYCFGANGKNPCPVRQECLWYAVSHDEQHGIWGGLSHRERNALIRKWTKHFKDKMTLEEYIFQLDKKEGYHGSTKNGVKEVS